MTEEGILEGELEAKEAEKTEQRRSVSDSTKVLLLVLSFSGLIPFLAAVRHLDWSQDGPRPIGDGVMLVASIFFTCVWVTWMAKLWDYLRTPLAEPAECSYEVVDGARRRYRLPFALMLDDAETYLMREQWPEFRDEERMRVAGKGLLHGIRNISAVDPKSVVFCDSATIELRLKPAVAASPEQASEAWRAVERTMREAAFIQVGAWPRFAREVVGPEPEPELIEVPVGAPCLQQRGGGFAANPE